MSARGAIADFIERLGLAFEAEGLPRIAGRLMALLVVEGGPYTFSELAERLEVSRASVSTNTRLLESRGIIERVTRRGDRHDYYQLAGDPYGQTVRGSLERMNRIASIVTEARSALPSRAAEAHKRLGEMERFYRYAVRETERFLDGWNVERSRR